MAKESTDKGHSETGQPLYEGQNRWSQMRLFRARSHCRTRQIGLAIEQVEFSIWGESQVPQD